MALLPFGTSQYWFYPRKVNCTGGGWISESDDLGHQISHGMGVEKSFETIMKTLALSYARIINLNKLMPIVISLICENDNISKD